LCIYLLVLSVYQTVYLFVYMKRYGFATTTTTTTTTTTITFRFMTRRF